MYMEEMIEETMKDMDDGLQLGGVWLKVTNTEKWLQKIIKRLYDTDTNMQHKKNVGKTKVMMIISKMGWKMNNRRSGKWVFKYGFLNYREQGGECKAKIRTRVWIAKDD